MAAPGNRAAPVGRHVLVGRRHEAADAGGAHEDNEDLADEGMLFIGDKRKDSVRLPGDQAAPDPEEPPAGIRGSVVAKDFDTTTPEDEWLNAIKTHTKSKGSFEQVAALAEAVALAGIALRVPYKRLPGFLTARHSRRHVNRVFLAGTILLRVFLFGRLGLMTTGAWMNVAGGSRASFENAAMGHEPPQ